MKSVYILKNQYGRVLSVCTSLEFLHESVDFWIKQLRGVTLTFNEALINNPLGCSYQIRWKWAYIAPNIDEKKFENKGVLPPQKFWNMNLVLVEFENGDYYSL